MPLYQITNDSLLALSSTSFQKESLWERRDLQRLLKVNIEVIDENAMVIAEEFGDWSESGRRIDLLAIDRNANLVVIELKRTDDGGHMELQAIRYAAMVANMTWDQAKQAFQKYLSDNQLELDAESRHRFNKAHEITFEGSGYYIARNWGMNNIQRFMDKMQLRFPEISYSSSAQE